MLGAKPQGKNTEARIIERGYRTMERYDYRQAMIEDVLEAIHDDYA
jgi:hypothetical protein